MLSCVTNDTISSKNSDTSNFRTYSCTNKSRTHKHANMLRTHNCTIGGEPITATPSTKIIMSVCPQKQEISRLSLELGRILLCFELRSSLLVVMLPKARHQLNHPPSHLLRQAAQFMAMSTHFHTLMFRRAAVQCCGR